MEIKRYYKDTVRPSVQDTIKKSNPFVTKDFHRIDSEIRFFSDETGEEIFRPLHNKTVIAGSALTAMKLFGLDRSALDNTPRYDNLVGTSGLKYPYEPGSYPAYRVKDANGDDVPAQ